MALIADLDAALTQMPEVLPAAFGDRTRRLSAGKLAVLSAASTPLEDFLEQGSFPAACDDVRTRRLDHVRILKGRE